MGYKFIPEEYIIQYEFLLNIGTPCINIIICRVLCILIVWILSSFLYILILKAKIWTTIKGNNYSIKIEYGNILKKKKCKRVINFDECFTTKVSDATADIKPASLCGQYLSAHPHLDVQKLIDDAHITPETTKSKYQQKTRYPLGTIVPNGDDLLLAFVRLDEKGKGRFFLRDEYLACLNNLWKELVNHYAEKDVCVPILGAGSTAFDGGSGASLSQQELLDMMIWSYRLSSYKIKHPYKLRIICRRNDNFSINDISKI